MNKLVAKCVNVSLGRQENVWSVEQPSLVKTEQDQDVLDKIVYTLANPVSSFLVSHGHKWPGLRMHPTDLLSVAIECSRPAVFFQENGQMPAVAKLTLTRPDIFPELSDEDFVALLQRKVEEREAEIRQKPRVAAKDKWRRIEALQRLKEFVADYRVAWLHWKQGFRDVLFPAGTYAMVKNANVACSSP